jgi:hypothetical protein
LARFSEVWLRGAWEGSLFIVAATDSTAPILNGRRVTQKSEREASYPQNRRRGRQPAADQSDAVVDRALPDAVRAVMVFSAKIEGSVGGSVEGLPFSQ